MNFTVDQNKKIDAFIKARMIKLASVGTIKYEDAVAIACREARDIIRSIILTSWK